MPEMRVVAPGDTPIEPLVITDLPEPYVRVVPAMVEKKAHRPTVMFTLVELAVRLTKEPPLKSIPVVAMPRPFKTDCAANESAVVARICPIKKLDGPNVTAVPMDQNTFDASALFFRDTREY